jgi:hypothetical protein
LLAKRAFPVVLEYESGDSWMRLIARYDGFGTIGSTDSSNGVMVEVIGTLWWRLNQRGPSDQLMAYFLQASDQLLQARCEEVKHRINRWWQWCKRRSINVSRSNGYVMKTEALDQRTPRRQPL